MSWLWIVGPLAVAVVYILTGMWPDSRRALELARWKAGFTPAPPKQKKKSAAVEKFQGYRAPSTPGEKEPLPGPKQVASLPSELARALDEAGGGSVVAFYQLVPKLAYLGVVDADAMCSSDYQIVAAKLAKTGPTFTARPLPIVEGSRIVNTGVQFKKDPAFMELFLVEGADAAAIGAWLRKPIRRVLCTNPGAWLFVRGRMMAVVLYGRADADEIDELIECADSIFAEVGAEGGPSLVGGHDDDEDSDEDEDEDDGDEDEDDDSDEEDDDEGDDEEDDGKGELNAPREGVSKPAEKATAKPPTEPFKPKPAAKPAPAAKSPPAKSPPAKSPPAKSPPAKSPPAKSNR